MMRGNADKVIFQALIRTLKKKIERLLPFLPKFGQPMV